MSKSCLFLIVSEEDQRRDHTFRHFRAIATSVVEGKKYRRMCEVVQLDAYSISRWNRTEKVLFEYLICCTDYI